MLSRWVTLVVGACTGRRTIVAFLALVLGGFALFQIAPYDDLKSRVGGAPLPEEGALYEGGLESFLRELGAEGRAVYRSFQLWDMWNPVLLGAAFTLLTGWLVRRARLEQNVARFAVVIPMMVAGADLIENALLLNAIAAFPRAGSVSALAPAVTAAKFGSLMVMMATIAILMVAAMIRGRAARKPRETRP